MDIPRPKNVRARRLKSLAIGIAVVGVVSIITVALANLKPAAPTVDRGTVWFGTVERGEMLRQVRGTGTLVPEEVRLIPAQTDGQIEQILAKPGTVVEPGTILMVLSNPTLSTEVRDAEWQLQAAEAELVQLRVELKSQLLQQEAEAARIQAEYHQARLKADTDEQLAKKGLISELTQKLSRSTSDELENRNRIEAERLRIASERSKAQLDVKQAQLQQLREQLNLKRVQLAALSIRAGLSGVLQEVPVEIGQKVLAGTQLARVAEPGRLKAELRIAETQAKDIQLNQKASIDTRNGVVAGHVVRIDPAVQQGTVTVDVAFDEALPTGARPDLSVDGTVEIERLLDISYVSRPVNGQPNSLVSLFKVDPDGATAVRVQVRFGRSSVNTIEVLEGLNPGDKVVLSDMSAWDSYDRINLK